MKRVSILGSTGSIGTQTLDVIRSHAEDFEVVALTCGENLERFIKQVEEFAPCLAVTGRRDGAETLSKYIEEHNLRSKEGKAIKVLHGPEGILEAAKYPSDLVVNALMGMRGLVPTLGAIETGHDMAFANKETLVAGGEIVMKAVREKGVKLLPVDSEHSAIFQCLAGGNKIRKILLTASGGPFRGWKRDELETVTPEMALKHPNWTMGKKITIDSATMMNKGLEVIEAKWLFDVDVEDIEILVHPQSIVHSGVEFMDKAILVQMGTPDMKVPISVALGYPERLDLDEPGLDFFGKGSNLTFEKPDMENFRCLPLAIESIKKGGTYPAAMNGANEVLVEMFLQGRIGFMDIPEIIERILEDHGDYIESEENGLTLDMILKADQWAREKAEEYAMTKRIENTERRDVKC